MVLPSRQMLEKWINVKLEPLGIMVQNLLEDVKDGFVLCNLCEALSGKSTAVFGKLSKVCVTV